MTEGSPRRRSERLAQTLAAMLDRLIPADAQGPGAVDAGVLDYVMSRYAGPGHDEAGRYARGLEHLDDLARRRHGTGFAASPAAAQDALLAELEAEALALPEAQRASSFFETVLRHAREGMFGDPVHGGNRGYAGWDLLGYPDARRVWTAREQALDVVTRPVLRLRPATPEPTEVGPR